MASKALYKGGDTKEILVKASATYPIEKGDLLFRDPATNLAMPASIRSNHGSVALNQVAFAQYFIGVALQKVGVESGETSFRLVTTDGYVRVATAGRFEFDCPATTWQDGAPVGIYASGTAAIPDPQKVMAADTTSSLEWERAIGVAAPGMGGLGASMTRVTVDIRSRLMDPDVATVGTYSGTSGQ